jgi:hypothetical protein
MRILKLSLYLWLSVMLAALNVLAQEAKREAVRTFTQTIEFNPHGVIQVVESFGELRVEGWDKDEVSITITKKSQKEYAAKDLPKAEAALDQIRIETETLGEGELLVIRTVFPARTPFRWLRGKSNAELEYVLKVPRTCGLAIKHDIGEVDIIGLTGDIEATSAIGEIHLEVPDDRPNAVNARAKIGAVESDFHPEPQRQGGFGAKLMNGYATGARRLYLRIGIGEIDVRKWTPKSE